MHMMVGKDRPLDLTSMLVPGANSITIKQNACACVSIEFFYISSMIHRKIERSNAGEQSYAFGITLFVRESEQLIRTRVMGRRKTIAEGQQLVNKLVGIKETIPESPHALPGTSSNHSSTQFKSADMPVQNTEDDDIECMQDSIKVSLRCPISLLRIKEPVKGIKCSHVEVS